MDSGKLLAIYRSHLAELGYNIVDDLIVNKYSSVSLEIDYGPFRLLGLERIEVYITAGDSLVNFSRLVTNPNSTVLSLAYETDIYLKNFFEFCERVFSIMKRCGYSKAKKTGIYHNFYKGDKRCLLVLSPDYTVIRFMNSQKYVLRLKENIILVSEDETLEEFLT